MAAEGGSKLQQSRASFNAFQFEIESRPQSPRMVSQESPKIGARPDDTGLESLVKALQEEAFVIRAELAEWKKKAGVAAQESVILKEELEGQITKLKAEVEGWRDRAAMSAGKGIVARRQLEDFGKQVKSLNVELQKWKDLTAECEEGSLKLRTEYEALRKDKEALHKANEDLQADRDQWMQKAEAANCSITALEVDLRQSSDESRAHVQELEHLRAEVEKWEKTAQIAQSEDDGLEVHSGSLSHSSSQASERWRDGPSALEMSLQAEVEGLKKKVASANLETEELDKKVASANLETEELKKKVVSANLGIEELKKKVVSANLETEELTKKHMAAELEAKSEIEGLKKMVVSAEKEQEQLGQQHEARMTELHVEVEAWKKRAACIAEDGKLERLDLEKRLKESQVKVRDATDFVTIERKRSAQEVAEVQAELNDWKVIAADASEECSSLRVAFDNVVKDLQTELALWKEKGEAVKSVKTDLEKVVENLEKEILVWKEKAESALEGAAKDQERAEHVIKELQAEIVQWKEKAEIVKEEGESVKADLEKVVEDLEKQVAVWKEKAETALEGVAKNQEYADLVRTLDSELCIWRQRTQEGKLLQVQLQEEQLQLKESLAETQNELQKWKDRAAAVTMSIGSLDDASSCGDGGDFLNVLESQLRSWKTKAQEGELLQSQLKNALAEAQKELSEWKQKAAAVTLATESLKEELDCVIEEGKLEREDLYSSINELEAGLFLWRERAQECQSLQTDLMSSQVEVKELKEKLRTSQTELKEWKEKAVAVTLTTRSLMEELDFRIEEGLQEKQEFCNSISALKESVLGWKEKATENESMVLELNHTLMETQKSLREWKDRATSVATATESLRAEMDCTLEDHRLEKEELCNTINDLEAEVYEWKARAQDGIAAQRQLERALSELERKKRPLLRAHKSGSGSY